MHVIQSWLFEAWGPTFFSVTVPNPGRFRHQKNFQKNFRQKKKLMCRKIWNFFFFQKVDFWGFHIQPVCCLIFQSQSCLGSGLTWHMKKSIFTKKNSIFFGKLNKGSGEYSKIISERMKGTTILVWSGD